MYEMYCVNEDNQWMFELSTNDLYVALDMQLFYEYHLGTPTCIRVV